MAEKINGNSLAKKILVKTKKATEAFEKKHSLPPGLAVILVGKDPASEIYVSKKQQACEETGIYSEQHYFSSRASQEEIIAKVRELNANKRIHGILVQLPLPKQINEQEVISSISPEKDVDGFSPETLGKLFEGNELLAACTPKGIVELAEHAGVSWRGKNVCIIGHTVVVGKPLALMLLNRDATVSVCHKFTKNLEDFSKKADVVVSATGVKHLVKESMIKEGSVLIDVGIIREGKKVFGDISPEAQKKSSKYTPVPGGVGPMTVACLMKNTLNAAKLQMEG